MSHTEVYPYSYFQWCGYFQCQWVSFVLTDEFSVIATKVTSRIGLMNSQPTFLFLTQWIMTILSKGCKPDNFEPYNSLKLSFTNIQGLCSNFVECEYFLESNSPDILALCESNLDDLIDSGNFLVRFLVRRYLPLIQNDSIAHMMVLQFMWRKDFFCTRLISRKLWGFLLTFLTCFTSLSVTSFSSIDHLLCYYARFLILFHLT